MEKDADSCSIASPGTGAPLPLPSCRDGAGRLLTARALARGGYMLGRGRRPTQLEAGPQLFRRGRRGRISPLLGGHGRLPSGCAGRWPIRTRRTTICRRVIPDNRVLLSCSGWSRAFQATGGGTMRTARGGLATMKPHRRAAATKGSGLGSIGQEASPASPNKPTALGCGPVVNRV
jgi:hypothetical protein